jgi:dTDP-4-amino-4,6-dideoxygalactose transaminase
MLRGEMDRYEWTDLGSNHAPSDITAAVLLAQLERADEIVAARRRIWEKYHSAFAALEQAGLIRRPVVPAGVEHNAHIYYLLLPSLAGRDRFISGMRTRGISTPFHFTPLDASPAGKRYGRAHGSLSVTHSVGNRLVRLPLWYGMKDEPERVIEAAIAELGR